MPDRTARKNAPTNTLLCPDWVFATSSNVAVARDRAWFKDYTPFVSHLPSAYDQNSAGAAVAGIGTVELILKKHPNRRGPSNHTKLLLAEVLHVPTASCNFFGFEGLGKVSINFGCGETGTRGSITSGEGHRVGYFHDRGPFFQLQLSGPPVGPPGGPSLLNDGQIRLINAAWPDSERQRWDQYKRSLQMANFRPPASDVGMYTADEKTWLKRNYDGEFKFLRTYGVSIYKEDDRDEGRRIVRALRFYDNSEDDEDGEDEEDEEGEEDEEDEDEDFEGHMADYAFSHEGLDWITKHYHNSMNFMATFGLKFYDDDDQVIACRLVEEMMKESR